MKTILVTGSNGLLGQKIVSQLKSHQDVRLIATSKGKNRISSPDGYLYQMLDIRMPLEVKAILTKFRPNAVINTAAMTNVNACEDDQEACEKINVEAVSNLIQVCHEYDTHLTHLSTDFVFDGENGPYKETDETNPLSFYAKTKKKSEILLDQSDVRSAILRTILVYGVCEKMSHSNFVLWAVNNLGTGKPIKVVTDQYRSPTLAEDLARACIAAALKEVKGIYHIGGPETKSIAELMKEVADVFGFDQSLMTETTTDKLDEPAPRPAKTGFILDKAKKDLDYKPRSFTEGLALVKEQLQTIDYKMSS